MTTALPADIEKAIIEAHPGWNHDEFEVLVSTNGCPLKVRAFREAAAVLAEHEAGAA